MRSGRRIRSSKSTALNAATVGKQVEGFAHVSDIVAFQNRFVRRTFCDDRPPRGGVAHLFHVSAHGEPEGFGARMAGIDAGFLKALRNGRVIEPVHDLPVEPVEIGGIELAGDFELEDGANVSASASRDGAASTGAEVPISTASEATAIGS